MPPSANPSMPPPGPPRASQSSISTSQPTPIIVPKPNVKYSTVERPPCNRGEGMGVYVMMITDYKVQIYSVIEFFKSAICNLQSAIHDPPAPAAVPIAALRAAGDVHAPAARDRSERPRRGDRRRAVRRRHIVSSRRAVRAARSPESVVADPLVQLFSEGVAVRPPERRR